MRKTGTIKKALKASRRRMESPIAGQGKARGEEGPPEMPRKAPERPKAEARTMNRTQMRCPTKEPLRMKRLGKPLEAAKAVATRIRASDIKDS
jgi:hypothetical protein